MLAMPLRLCTTPNCHARGDSEGINECNLIDENELKSLSTSNEAKVLEEGKDDAPFLTTGQDQHVCSQVNQSECEHTYIMRTYHYWLQ